MALRVSIAIEWMVGKATKVWQPLVCTNGMAVVFNDCEPFVKRWNRNNPLLWSNALQCSKYYFLRSLILLTPWSGNEAAYSFSSKDARIAGYEIFPEIGASESVVSQDLYIYDIRDIKPSWWLFLLLFCEFVKILRIPQTIDPKYCNLDKRL